ncbi:MAG: methyl-accepting chemotaxis protein [Myxococcales bacterium]
MLALNAALEGTKAGEAGRGFSLVATQMQKLAENVMGSVRDIKELAATITQATQASVLATEESTKLAADTTQSARQIAQVIGQQQNGTEQVTLAMNEVSKIAQDTTEASVASVHCSQSLIALSETLQSLVNRITDDAAGFVARNR